MNERDELARMLPSPPVQDLSGGRHRLVRESLMSEVQNVPARRSVRSTVLVGACVLAVATVLASILPALVGSGPRAYAVTDNSDGTITIKIYEAKDAKGLQATLQRRGFNVIVDYVPADKSCSPQPRSTTWVPGVRLASPQTAEEETEGAGFRIDPSVVKSGQTAVLEFLVHEVDGELQGAGISDRVSDGPVADCQLVDRAGGSRQPVPDM